MLDPIIPAGTPPAPIVPGGQPATPPAQTPAPANITNPGIPTLAQPPAQNPPAGEFILNQEQFNARWGEKMTALEKDLGMPLKDLKPFLEANKKPPKLVPSTATDPLTGADLRIAKMESLMLAGVPSKKIPGLLSRVQGKTKADIEADIQQMVADGFLIIGEPAPTQVAQPPQLLTNQVQGAGNPGVPPGPKTWTKEEIAGLTPEQHEKHRLDIIKAMQEGRVK